MNGTWIGATLGLLCAFAGGEGGKPGPAPPPAKAPPAKGATDLATVKSETGTFEFQAPSGYTVEEPKKAGIVLQLAYTGAPYLSTKIKVYTYEGYRKPEHLEGFMKFFEKSIGGNITYENDAKTRFTADIQAGGTWWISQVEGRIEPPNGFAIECLVPKDVYDETKDVWSAVADSFKTFPPPKDPYELPAGWKLNKSPMFAVMGPMADVKEKKGKDLLERRLAQVQQLLDIDQPVTKMFRTTLNDERKVFPRCPIHVQPTTEGFKAETGAAWVEGTAAIYLPDHAERILVIDGSPDGGFRDDVVLAEAGVQYVESRLGKTWPWMRAAFRLYFEAGLKKNSTPGLFPPEMLKKAREAFAKTPAAFDDLMKADEAAMAALGEDGRIVAWGLLQYGMHGPDAGVRNVFRGFLRDGAGAPDLAAVWEKCVAHHKEETKKVLRTRDLDAAAKKYFRDMKEEKK